MVFPAVAVAGPLFTIDTSADALIVVITVELSFAGFESALDVDAVAVLLTTVPFATVGAACTVRVNCALPPFGNSGIVRSEEHTSELQSLAYLVCRLLLEKKKKINVQR